MKKRNLSRQVIEFIEKYNGHPIRKSNNMKYRMKEDASSELINASIRGNADMVKELLGAGANVNTQKNQALIYASEYNHVDVVKILLDAGADVHEQDDEALKLANKYGHVDVVKLLKEYGRKSK